MSLFHANDNNPMAVLKYMEREDIMYNDIHCHRNDLSAFFSQSIACECKKAYLCWLTAVMSEDTEADQFQPFHRISCTFHVYHPRYRG